MVFDFEHFTGLRPIDTAVFFCCESATIASPVALAVAVAIAIAVAIVVLLAHAEGDSLILMVLWHIEVFSPLRFSEISEGVLFKDEC